LFSFEQRGAHFLATLNAVPPLFLFLALPGFSSQFSPSWTPPIGVMKTFKDWLCFLFWKVVLCLRPVPYPILIGGFCSFYVFSFFPRFSSSPRCYIFTFFATVLYLDFFFNSTKLVCWSQEPCSGGEEVCRRASLSPRRLVRSGKAPLIFARAPDRLRFCGAFQVLPHLGSFRYIPQ